MHVVEVKHKDYEYLRQYIINKSFVQPFEVLLDYDLEVEGYVYRIKLHLDKYKIAIFQAIRRKKEDTLYESVDFITEKKVLISLLNILICQYRINQEKMNL